MSNGLATDALEFWKPDGIQSSPPTVVNSFVPALPGYLSTVHGILNGPIVYNTVGIDNVTACLGQWSLPSLSVSLCHSVFPSLCLSTSLSLSRSLPPLLTVSYIHRKDAWECHRLLSSGSACTHVHTLTIKQGCPFQQNAVAVTYPDMIDNQSKECQT